MGFLAPDGTAIGFHHHEIEAAALIDSLIGCD